MMSPSDNSQHEINSQSQKTLENTGNADVETFTAHSNEIESITDHIEEVDQLDNIEIMGDKEGHWVVKYRPSKDGASKSSARNDDFNILHEDEDVVKEFLEKFENAEEIERENLNAVISQGRNISDIIAHMYDEPIKKFEGEWSEIVLAADENSGQPDEVIIHPTYDSHEKEVVAKRFRGGNKSRTEMAAEFNLDFYNEESAGLEGHNAVQTAIGDTMVGRGHETDSSIRNTELLMHTITEIDEPVELDKVDYIEFELESEIENNPAKSEYNVKIIYDDDTVISGTAEELAYSSEIIEQMDSVEVYLEEDGAYSNLALSAVEMWGNLLETGIRANPLLSTGYDSRENPRAD